MSIHEIVLPETEPETEWIDGRAVQKVSPTFSHARLQGTMFTLLDAWSEQGGHGRVGTEWRFRIAPPGEIVRPLVPDVAYLSYEALPRDADPSAFEVPLGAPTVAVEVLSPDDRRQLVNEKTATYLAAGTALVLIVDPTRAKIAAHDPERTRILHGGDRFEHPSLPGFVLDVCAYFERAIR